MVFLLFVSVIRHSFLWLPASVAAVMAFDGLKLYSCHLPVCCCCSCSFSSDAVPGGVSTGRCGLCNLLRQLRFNYKRATNCQVAGLTMTVASLCPSAKECLQWHRFLPRGERMPLTAGRHSSIDNWNASLMS